MGLGDQRAIGDALRVEDLGEDGAAASPAATARRRAARRTAASAMAGESPRPLPDRVQHGQRKDSIGVADGPVEADRAADVMDDEMAAIDLEGVDRRSRPPGQSRPRVVESLRALGQPEAREIEGDSAQALVGEHGQDLAVEERARRHAVQADDVRATALLADESDRSRPPRRPARQALWRAIASLISRATGRIRPGLRGRLGSWKWRRSLIVDQSLRLLGDDAPCQRRNPWYIPRVGSFNPVLRGQEGARVERKGRPRPRRPTPHADADRARDR